MKLCKLKLKNLNSFREEVELDFEKSPLDDASLVAITGPTGAGKTTLLDAICVALYGKTPRLSGTGSQNPSYLISHGEKEGFAEVSFMANETRYLATWSLKRGSPPRVQLFYAEDGKLISDRLSSRGKSLGSSQNTVSEEVESILGLDFDAFKRSVMLAQGEFAAFLKASNEERRTILEATAGIGIYDALKQALNEKVGEVEAANAAVADELNKIPEASRDQVAEAGKDLGRLQQDAKRIDEEIQEIQKEKARETRHTEEFEKLQSFEGRRKELLDQQSRIDALESERKFAEKAQRLLPEKQAYDRAKADLERAGEAFSAARAEKTDAEERVKADQAGFDGKAKGYQAAYDDHDRWTEIYSEAKSDVERAKERFAEAERRTPKLEELSNQICILSKQLTDRQAERDQLKENFQAAQIFLDENPLPSDRQQRLNRATGLLAKLGSQENQLETTSTNKAQIEEKVMSLMREIEGLSETRKKRLSEKTDAEAAFETAAAELNALREAGAREEWITRKQKAVKAQPISQKYEAKRDDLADSRVRLRELSESKARLNAELEQIQTELANQTEECQRAEGAVLRCEEARESAMLANPINQLRQHLHTGEPCLVCGATEHPCADAVEPEDENLLQDAETALENAKVEAEAAQDRMQALKTRQAQTEQNKSNTVDQIKECTKEIEKLREDAALFLAQWQEIYPDVDVSSDWTAQQIEKADSAIADLGEAEQAHTQALHACQMASQQLETCLNNIARETQSLNEAKEQLENASDEVEGLKATIRDIHARFWSVLPEAFHGFAPAAALEQFTEKIEQVAAREEELQRTVNELQLLETNIGTDRRHLDSLLKNHGALQAEKDRYQCEGETILNAVREKTNGLETEAEIDAANENLRANLQTKKNERDQAERRLQESRNLSTEKKTAHGICEDRHGECGKKIGKARQVYFDRLEAEGFDSPEAHDIAFRNDAQIQEIIGQIEAHTHEVQQLALEITELQTRFEENPFDPETLGRITAQVEEIEAYLRGVQQKIGAQQKKIDDLKDALEKREALGDQQRKAQQELQRWKRLQATIPANALRDFALEIIFEQMRILADEQLKHLTSERYQLKVKTIGDLTVVDRWNANEERPVETLSGGESFLTSLALALALSELSRGRAQLNSLFLDEGFGTLDAETLEVAMAALEGLRLQGRSIFLISHIQELTRRLPVKIKVRKRGNGSSFIQV